MSAEFLPNGLPGAPDSSPGDTMMMDAAAVPLGRLHPCSNPAGSMRTVSPAAMPSAETGDWRR